MELKYKLVDLEQGSLPWLDYRASRIGSSDIPSIAGAPGAYKSRNAVMKEKLLGASAVNSFTQRIFDKGHTGEATVRDYYRKQGVIFTPAVVESLENPEYFASLDGLSNDADQFIEVKQTSKIQIVESVKAGIIPPVFNFQMQWGLGITECKSAKLIVFFKSDLYSIIVRPDVDLFKNLKACALSFITQRDQYVVLAKGAVK